MTEAKCDSPGPSSWTVCPSDDCCDGRLGRQPRELSAAGRVIVSGNGSLLVSSGRERARAEFERGEWALDSEQSTRRSWSCSWGNPSAGISGRPTRCRRLVLAPSKAKRQKRVAEWAECVLCPCRRIDGAAGEPPTHPRTHAHTYAPCSWVAPAALVGDVGSCYLAAPFIHFVKSLQLNTTQQAIKPLSQKRRTLRGACIDHDQQPAPPTSMRSIVHWLHPAKLLSQV